MGGEGGISFLAMVNTTYACSAQRKAQSINSTASSYLSTASSLIKSRTIKLKLKLQMNAPDVYCSWCKNWFDLFGGAYEPSQLPQAVLIHHHLQISVSSSPSSSPSSSELGFLSPSADSIHTCCCLVSLLCLLDFMFQFSTSYISLLWSVNCSNWLLIYSPLTTAQIPERLDIQDEEEEVLELLLLQPHWNPTAVTHPLPQFASPVPAALFTHLACLRTYWLACSPSTAGQLHMPSSDPPTPSIPSSS